MRVRSLIAVLAALLLLAATGATAQNTSGVLKYDTYGFSVTIPTPFERTTIPNTGQINGLLEAYRANGLIYAVFATDDIKPTGTTARAALNMLTSMMSQAAGKVPGMGLHTISSTSAQGVAAVGFGVRLDEATLKKASKGGMDWAAAIPAELRQLFGSDIYQAVAMVPANEKSRMIFGVGAIGPGSRSGEIDGEVTRVMRTLTMGAKAGTAGSQAKASSEAPTAVPAPTGTKAISVLSKGQIELIGTVSSLDQANKSLNMMVSQVTSFGQTPMILNPTRLKRVLAKALPADVKEGSKIVVVAGDSGVGKPVNAASIAVMEAAK